jgi:hypothetical protein
MKVDINLSEIEFSQKKSVWQTFQFTQYPYSSKSITLYVFCVARKKCVQLMKKPKTIDVLDVTCDKLLKTKIINIKVYDFTKLVQSVSKHPFEAISPRLINQFLNGMKKRTPFCVAQPIKNEHTRHGTPARASGWTPTRFRETRLAQKKNCSALSRWRAIDQLMFFS